MRRTARASKTVSTAACSSPACRREPPPHVSSVNCALALLFLCESQLRFNKGNKTATHNKPANTLRCGNIKATIWQNVSDKGPSSERPSPTHSGISPACGVMGPRSVSMTSKRLLPSPVTPRSGSPLIPSNPEGMCGKPPALPGLPMQLHVVSDETLHSLTKRRARAPASVSS
jgi:hypothetical protein